MANAIGCTAGRIAEHAGDNDANELRRMQSPMNEPSSRPDLPDRLSTDPRSPHHDAAVLERPIGIRFNGRERHDVEEYCVSEGWIKVPHGKARDRRGQPLLVTLKGSVEPFYR